MRYDTGSVILESRKNSGIIKPFTSLRFFFAVYIFIFHSRVINFSGTGISAYINNVIMDGGYSGVTFFFVLSGFVITYTYHNRLDKLNIVSVRNFYVSRIARIYPSYLLITIFVLPFSLTRYGYEKVLHGLFVGLTLTQSLSPHHWGRLIGPAWALSDEVVFYALTPLIFVGIAFVRSRVNNRIAWMRIATAGMVVLWVVVSAAMLTWYPGVGKKSWLLYVAPYFRIAEYLIGVMLAHAFLSVNTDSIKAGRSAFTVLEIIAVAAYLSSLAIRPYVDPVLQNGMFFVPFCVLIISVFYFQRGIVSELLSGRTMVFLGNLSFVFFLVHNPVQAYFNIIPAFSVFGGVKLILIEFIVALAASVLIYKYVEEPFRRKIIERFRAKG